MIFENEKIYKILKKIWMYAIPALGFLWEGLYKIWNIPFGNAILGTIVVVWGAMAIFLGISKWKYNNATEGYLSDGRGEDDDIFSVDESVADNEE